MNNRCIREVRRGGRTREGRWLCLGPIPLLPLSPFGPPLLPTPWLWVLLSLGFQPSPYLLCWPKGLARCSLS